MKYSSFRPLLRAGLLTLLLPLITVLPGYTQANPAPVSSAYPFSLSDFSEALSDLTEKASPAVVTIRTTQFVRYDRNIRAFPPGVGNNDDELREFFQRFFGIPSQPPRPGVPDQQDDSDDRIERGNGIASGFIISADGFIVTNAHVVEQADNLYITLSDKREFKAKVVGFDSPSDLALLKIDATNLPIIKTGDSSKIREGSLVIAIGAQFGFINSVTQGVISAKRRTIVDPALSYIPFIQTDAAINVGNSGGPLINMRGEAIGVNSVVYTAGTGRFVGISFAIPINEAMQIVEQLKTTGKVEHGFIGITYGPVTREVADALSLPNTRGAFISYVIPGGAAHRAGLQSGDIILKFNGQNIEEFSDLKPLVSSLKPGTKITVTVLRKGKELTLPLTIIVKEPSDSPMQKKAHKQPPVYAKKSLGLAVVDIPDEQLRALKLRSGVMVESATGMAARKGIQRGDIILRIGNTDVTSAKQFGALTRALDPRKMVAVLVRRGDVAQFVALRPRADNE
jgi:serine protease Do